jgi:hypothetical protein
MRSRMNRCGWWVVGVVALVLASSLRAGDNAKSGPGPLERQTLDQRLAEVLKIVHNRGADLYNSGDAAGCYRLFQGTLLTVRPLLDHHADAQKAIDTGLSEAENDPDVRKRAFTLHRLIEDVRGHVKAAGKEK